jgi:hypothetical protein
LPIAARTTSAIEVARTGRRPSKPDDVLGGVPMATTARVISRAASTEVETLLRPPAINTTGRLGQGEVA